MLLVRTLQLSILLPWLIQSASGSLNGFQARLSETKSEILNPQINAFHQMDRSSSSILPGTIQTIQDISSSQLAFGNGTVIGRLRLHNKFEQVENSLNLTQQILQSRIVQPQSLKNQPLTTLEAFEKRAEFLAQKDLNEKQGTEKTTKEGKIETKHQNLRKLNELPRTGNTGTPSPNSYPYSEELKALQRRKADTEATNRLVLVIGFGFVFALVLILACIYFLFIRRRIQGDIQELAEEEDMDDVDNFQFWENYISSIVENPEKPQAISPINQDEALSVSPARHRHMTESKSQDQPHRSIDQTRKDDSIIVEKNDKYKKVNEDSRLEESVVVAPDDESVIQKPEQSQPQ